MYQNYNGYYGYYGYPYNWNYQEYLRKQHVKQLRRGYSAQGWALLVYYGIMNVAVIIVMVLDMILQMGSSVRQTGDIDFNWVMEQIYNNSGWGYFVAIGFGFLALLLWKKARFTFGTIWQKNKPMKVGGFLQILSIFMSAQMVFMLLSLLAELLLNQFGLTTQPADAITLDGLSMFLYTGLGAPISEEILFRGLILRSIQPYGKKFAIFSSALLFGLFHGNLSQAPFAFIVGLVLGYVTVEHNIGWAMVLHMFNNLIISDNLGRLAELMPGETGALLLWAIIGLFTIAAIIILIAQRKNIKAYLQNTQDDPACAQAFWSAPGIIVMVSLLGLSILLSMITGVYPLE